MNSNETLARVICPWKYHWHTSPWHYPRSTRPSHVPQHNAIRQFLISTSGWYCNGNICCSCVCQFLFWMAWENTPTPKILWYTEKSSFIHNLFFMYSSSRQVIQTTSEMNYVLTTIIQYPSVGDYKAKVNSRLLWSDPENQKWSHHYYDIPEAK